MKSLDINSLRQIEDETGEPSCFSPTKTNPSFGVKAASIDVVQQNGLPTPLENRPIGVSGLPALAISSIPLEFLENLQKNDAGDTVDVLPPQNEELYYYKELSEDETRSVDDELEDITSQISMVLSNSNGLTSQLVKPSRHEDNLLASDIGTLSDMLGADWEDDSEKPALLRLDKSSRSVSDSGIESWKTEYSLNHQSYSEDFSLVPIHEECFIEEVIPLSDTPNETVFRKDSQSRTVTPDYDSELSSRDLSMHNLDAFSQPSHRNFRKSSSLSQLPPCSPHRPRYRHWTPPPARQTRPPQITVDINSLLEFAREHSATSYSALTPSQDNYEESMLRLRGCAAGDGPVASNGSPSRVANIYQLKSRGFLEIIQEAIDSVQTLVTARVTVPFVLAGICVVYRKVFYLSLLVVIVVIVCLYLRYYMYM